MYNYIRIVWYTRNDVNDFFFMWMQIVRGSTSKLIYLVSEIISRLSSSMVQKRDDHNYLATTFMLYLDNSGNYSSQIGILNLIDLSIGRYGVLFSRNQNDRVIVHKLSC